VVGHRKPTVDCDAEISYCRQWVEAGVQQLNVSCSDLVQLLLGPELVPFSSYLTLNNIVTLKSGLEVTQCH